MSEPRLLGSDYSDESGEPASDSDRDDLDLSDDEDASPPGEARVEEVIVVERPPEDMMKPFSFNRTGWNVSTAVAALTSGDFVLCSAVPIESSKSTPYHTRLTKSA